jgi:altronate dehydratase small subunit
MKNDNFKTIMMSVKDNVAVALSDIAASSTVKVVCEDEVFMITLQDQVDFGHKFAVVQIKKGEDILKYGEVIGVANQDIFLGEHVHVHNLDGKRGRGDKVVK